jgi:transcriptional regulator with XRE-family HTH domain
VTGIRNMADFNLEQFGDRVRKVREALDISQKKLGEAVNLSASFISDIEKGKSRAGYDFFYYISTVYGVNLYYLVHGEGDMFGTAGVIPSLGSKKIGEGVETTSELLWYIENIPYIKHMVFGFATKSIFDNEALIKREMKNKSRKEKKQAR